jgi:hypothetical protein
MLSGTLADIFLEGREKKFKKRRRKEKKKKKKKKKTKSPKDEILHRRATRVWLWRMFHSSDHQMKLQNLP